MSGNFNLRAHTLESNPPAELAAKVGGTDSVTRSALSSDVIMKLTAISDTETELQQAVVEIKGPPGAPRCQGRPRDRHHAAR